MRASRVCRFWEESTASCDYDRLASFWRRAQTSFNEQLTSDSIPRRVHDFVAGACKRDGASLRWYPYKQEATVAQRRVRTVRDAVYSFYFPREYNDDERVKYISVRTGRSEAAVASELFTMRRARLYAAETLRDVLFGAMPRPLLQLSEDSLEARYARAAREAAIELAMSDTTLTMNAPTLMYSPYLDVADCLDALAKQTLYASLQYVLCDVVVHKGVARARLPQVRGDAKPPLAHLEPCLYEFCKLRLAILAAVAKQESYVVDHAHDTGHKYTGCLVHLFPSPHDPRVVTHDTDVFALDLNLAWQWMKHYRTHHATCDRAVIF